MNTYDITDFILNIKNALINIYDAVFKTIYIKYGLVSASLHEIIIAAFVVTLIFAAVGMMNGSGVHLSDFTSVDRVEVFDDSGYIHHYHRKNYGPIKGGWKE